MQKIFTTEFKVGITVITATLILILGIIWGKEYRFQPNKYKIQVVFENVGGMVVGDPVTVNGLKEGKIVDIGWRGREVICTLEINDRVQLYEDASFVVISAELLAGMKVEIDPGKSPTPINLSKQPFSGRYGGRIVDVGLTIDELSRDLSALTLRMDTTVAMINDMMRQGDLQNNIQKTLANISAVTDELRGILSGSTGDLKSAIQNFNSGTARLNKIMVDNEADILDSVHNMKLISSRLDSMSTSLRGMLKKIENQEGTLGKMVYDPSLYENLVRTLSSIDSLAKKIEKDGLDIDLF